MHFQQERIGNFHSQVDDIFIKSFPFCTVASLKHNVCVKLGIVQQVLTEFPDGAKFAVQMIQFEFFIYPALLGNTDELHRQIMTEKAIHDRILCLVDKKLFHRSPQMFIDIGLL